MNKKKILQITAGVILLATSITVGASLAWFHPSAHVGGNEGGTNVLPIDGSSASSYFAYGKGTSTDPYGIRTPRQLYNLAWLQYLGYLDLDTKQQYFELAKDLDMTGWTLPPIGTETNPFIGNFDGNNYTISNLTVSNSFEDYATTGHPSTVDSDTFEELHIVGLFGIIGNYGKTIAGYVPTANAFTDTGIKDVTVKTTFTNSLVGIAAGYVDGGMSSVAVEKGTIDLVSSGTTTSYGGFTTNISDYTVVGYTTNKASFKKVSENVYDVSVQTGQEFVAQSMGNASGWGGSIDMNSVYDRIGWFENGQTRSEIAYEYDHNYAIGAITPTIVENTNNTQNVYKVNKYQEAVTENGQTVNKPRYFGSVVDYIQSTSKHYLGGGVYHVNKRLETTPQSIECKISDGSGHYLVGTAGSNNPGNSNSSGTVSSTESLSSASTWHIEENDSVYIYTTITANNNTRNHYLFWYVNSNGSMVLRLSTSANDRTPFERETIEDNGVTKVRYTFDGRYLAYDSTANTWTMLPLPSVETPTVPYPPDRSTYEGMLLDMPENAAETKQICYTSGGNTYYLHATTSSYSASTTPFADGWDLSTSGTTTIKLHGQSYYLYPSSGPSMSMSASSRSWTITAGTGTNNGKYRFSYKYSSRPSRTGYLRYNNGGFEFSGTDSNDYLSIVTTEQAVNAYNSAIDVDALYNAALAEYNNTIAHLYDDYQDALDNLPARIKASYYITYHNETITTGTGYYSSYDTETSYFEYTSDNTTYLPINVYKENVYDTNNNLIGRQHEATPENTGYFIAGSTGERWADGDDSVYCPRSIIFSSYPINNKLGKCYSGGSFNDSSIYTIDEAGPHSIVVGGSIDEEKYSKYQSSKTSLEGVLSGKSNVGGFHFFAKNPDLGEVSKDRVLKAANVRMMGKDKESFELPVNALDFYLKEKGRINFLAGMYNGGGSYGTTGDNHMNGFFSFHRVYRDEQTEEITRIREIKWILEDMDTEEYVYTYKDGVNIVDEAGNEFDLDSGNYKLLFNTDWIGYNDLDGDAGRVYYFEIPADVGEYCFGGYKVPASAISADGAYLMYLDIASNAAKIQRTSFAEHFIEEMSVYSYPLGIALISTESITGDNPTFDEKNTVCVVIQPSSLGEIIITRTGDDVSVKRTTDNKGFVKPSYISDTIQSVVDPGLGSTNNSIVGERIYDSFIQKETYRIQYYDYDVNHDVLKVTKIEDIREKEINASSDWGDFERKIYQKEGTGAFVELTLQSQITNGTITIFKYFGPSGNNASYNGIVWTLAELQDLDALLYYNGALETPTTVTMAAICGNPNAGTILSLLAEYAYDLESETPPPEVDSVDIQLEAVVDSAITTGTYYKFNDYLIIPTVENGNVVFVVKSIASGRIFIFVDGETQTQMAANTSYTAHP